MSGSFKFAFCLALCSVTIAACSSSSGGGKSAVNGPQNKDEALAQLPPGARQSFEGWKQRVVKACDASDAFGLSHDDKIEADGIDGGALIQTNGGSIVFSDNGSLAVLGAYHSFAGTGDTKAEESQEINGQGYTIAAETKRDGSICEVYLFGQKVYETYIAESFDVGIQWTSGKHALAASAVPLIRNIGTSGAGEVVEPAVYSLLSQALRPSKESLTMLANKLGLNERDAGRLFKLGGDVSLGSAVRIANESSAVWSNREGGNLIAQTDILKTDFDGASRVVPLEVRLAMPSFSFGATRNSADNGNLKLAVQVLVSEKDAAFNYSAQSVELQGLASFDKPEGVECAKERGAVYIGSSADSNQIRPSVQMMLSPCRTLYADIEKTSYENGFLKSLVPQVFAGVSPSSQTQYGGWDQVLSQLALVALEQGKNIRSELDPNSNTRVVGIVADHLLALKQELGRTKNLAPAKASVFQMGLNWSFHGQIVSSSRIAQILQAIDNSIETFQVSSERLLGDLGDQPNGGDQQLNFAQSIDGTYKAEAKRALALSRDLNYSDFEREVYNQVLQRTVTIDELKDWSTKLSGIKIEINKYSGLGPVKGELVGLSVKWLKSGEASLSDLGAVYSAFNNSVVPFDESSKQLIRALPQSLQENQDALAFARSISPEYKQLAVSIRDNSKSADYESWGEAFFSSVLQKRPTLEQLRSWNEMWLAALAFTQREKTRTQGEFGSTNEWNRKKVIEVAVKENWSSADFAGLEIIAEVARAKNTCDHYKGYSSLADCGGMSLFSKQKGMFLDPAFGGRYAGLGRDFAGYMNQLSGFDWTSLRWSLIGEFFGSFEPIWSKCDQSGFSQKATTLKTEINSIARESDQLRKWDLEREIKETLNNCQ